jgi:hypothetical protein
MFYDPLILFATLMVLLNHALEQREKERKPQGQHAFLLSKRGRYVMRRLGIFLMRIGGKLVYLGSTPC